MRYSFIILLSICILACENSDGQSDTPTPTIPTVDAGYTPEVSLKEAASFPVGMATQAAYLDFFSYTDVLDKEFNSLTAEYQMKQNIIHTGPTAYNWGPSDALVNYGRRKGMRVHGHALVWHQSVPDWLENFEGTDAEFEEIVKSYIQTVVNKYGTDVASWDVVNEAFNDQGGIRETVFLERMGTDYVAKCFQYAREANPDMLLFYNDYGTVWDQAKLTNMLAMLNDFQKRGIPVDGVGLQMHITYNFPEISRIQFAVDELVKRGLKVHFSEVDIRVNPDGDISTFTGERAKAQEDRMREIVQAYQTIPPDLQFGITFWGLRDGDSWLINFWGNPEWPLLFTDAYQHKLAHKGFVEGL
ncbi:MAG: endo-1,4-beta-xylanase [Bacteroidota bacterium]